MDCSLIDQLRSFKILNMAVFDWVATALGVYLLQIWLWPEIPFLRLMAVATIVGVLVHYVMGIDTMFNYYLGLSEMPIRKAC